jgi:hypothetical protein
VRIISLKMNIFLDFLYQIHTVYYMNRTKSKFTPPTWEEMNNEQLFIDLGYAPECAKQRVVGNNELRDFLVKNGWSIWDGGNCYENGYTINMRKPSQVTVQEGKPYVHPLLHFEWYWDNCGGPDFFRGKMFTFYNYSPECKFSTPAAIFEIFDIVDRHLKNLQLYEHRLKSALLSQAPIEDNLTQ